MRNPGMTRTTRSYTIEPGGRRADGQHVTVFREEGQKTARLNFIIADSIMGSRTESHSVTRRDVATLKDLLVKVLEDWPEEVGL